MAHRKHIWIGKISTGNDNLSETKEIQLELQFAIPRYFNYIILYRICQYCFAVLFRVRDYAFTYSFCVL